MLVGVCRIQINMCRDVRVHDPGVPRGMWWKVTPTDQQLLACHAENKLVWPYSALLFHCTLGIRKTFIVRTSGLGFGNF